MHRYYPYINMTLNVRRVSTHVLCTYVFMYYVVKTPY